jgi:hypothetical protein
MLMAHVLLRDLPTTAALLPKGLCWIVATSPLPNARCTRDACTWKATAVPPVREPFSSAVWTIKPRKLRPLKQDQSWPLVGSVPDAPTLTATAVLRRMASFSTAAKARPPRAMSTPSAMVGMEIHWTGSVAPRRTVSIWPAASAPLPRLKSIRSVRPILPLRAMLVPMMRRSLKTVVWKTSLCLQGSQSLRPDRPSRRCPPRRVSCRVASLLPLC